MHRLNLLDFASLVGEPYAEVKRKAEQGKSVRNVDLAHCGVRDEYGEVRWVHVPSSLMSGLKTGAVSESSVADAFEAGRAAERESQETGASATVDGEPAEVEVERENPEQGEGEHSLPAKRPQKPTLMHQFGTFALYAGAAVGVGLAVKALLGSGNRPVR